MISTLVDNIKSICLFCLSEYNTNIFSICIVLITKHAVGYKKLTEGCTKLCKRALGCLVHPRQILLKKGRILTTTEGGMLGWRHIWIQIHRRNDRLSVYPFVIPCACLSAHSCTRPTASLSVYLFVWNQLSEGFISYIVMCDWRFPIWVMKWWHRSSINVSATTNNINAHLDIHTKLTKIGKEKRCTVQTLKVVLICSHK